MVALRSRALAALAGKGGMLSVAGPAAAVRDRIAAWGGRLSVAAVNGPAATVVSGDPEALAELAAACEAGRGADPAGAGGLRLAQRPGRGDPRGGPGRPGAGSRRARPRVPMVSAVTGQWLDGPELGAGYWYDSLRAPVEFERAVRALAASGHRVFIEASPHPVLTAAITETAGGRRGGGGRAAGGDRDAAPRRRRPGPVAGLAGRGVHARGVAVDWAAVLGGGRPVELPTYAFQRRRYWLAPPAARERARPGWGCGGRASAAGHGGGAGGRGGVPADRAAVGGGASRGWPTTRWPGRCWCPARRWRRWRCGPGAEAGCGRVEELALEAPLLLPAGARSRSR